MAEVSYFFWLGTQAIEVAGFFFPGFALLAVCGLIVSTVAAIRDPQPLRRKWALLLVPVVIPIAILGYGVAFNYTGPIGSAPEWRGEIIDVLFWSQVPIGIIITAILWRNPLVPLGVVGFLMWYSIGAAFMSGMSVTNVWL
jgi:hypothetical protein